MPCYDPRDGESRDDNRRACAILCGILLSQGPSVLDAIDWSRVGFSRGEAERWYFDHLHMDAMHKGEKPTVPDWLAHLRKELK